MQQMLKQAQKMQQQIAKAQAELAEAELTGTAGGGLVTATVAGTGELKAIKIDPKAVDPRADREEDGPARGRHGRPRPARVLSRQMYEGAIQDLIDELGRLPGVGPKSAQRIAFHVLSADPADVNRLAGALRKVKDLVRFCTTCYNVAESEQCRICRDPRRTDEVLCVVEEPKDVVAIERTGEFRGRYHVLGGAINPLEGIGPDNLRIRELMTRLSSGEVKELILATDPNTEGEATATYLALLVKPMGLAVTRLASGLPVGGDLEYADEITLGRAFEGRRAI